MKKLVAFLVIATLIPAIGCGRPGDTKKTKKGEGEKMGLTVSAEPGTPKLEIEGDGVDRKVTIERKGFKEDVKVSLSGLPDGVTADPKEATIKKDDKTAKFALKATKDAGETKEKKVTITAEGGKQTSKTEVTLTVAKKAKAAGTNGDDAAKKMKEAKDALQKKVDALKTASEEGWKALKAKGKDLKDDAKKKYDAASKKIADAEEALKKATAKLADATKDNWEAVQKEVNAALSAAEAAWNEAKKEYKLEKSGE